jgi:hypothetical protein
MDACIFIMTINALMPVYGPDRATTVDELSIGDKVCVTRIDSEWTTVHWSSGNVGHTGFLHNVTVKQNAQPTEPMPREEEYNMAPAAPLAPALPDPPVPPQNRSLYENTPTPPATMTRPMALAMQCYPEHSQPYVVVYVNGTSGIQTKTGMPHAHAVLEEVDNQRNHVFYVRAEGNGGHTLFYAFDYSQRGSDASAIRVVGDGYDAKDKCFMDWQNTR